jgi:hypothetical protein
MRKKLLFLFSLVVFSHTVMPAPKPKNKFVEVLGHMKILTGFALIPLGAVAAAYAAADHSLYYRLEPSQRKDLSIFAPLNPVVLFWASALCGGILMAWGAQDVQESKEISE